MPSKDQDQYGEAEADRRMADALKRALTTPHKPIEKFKGKSLPLPESAFASQNESAKSTRQLVLRLAPPQVHPFRIPRRTLRLPREARASRPMHASRFP